MVELLAVIVILGIIITIAVPILTNSINTSKESANRSSVTFYGKAIDNAVKNYMASNNGIVPSGIYYSQGKMLYLKTDNSSKDIGIDYKGNDVNCDIVTIYDDGEVYLSGCKVGQSEDYVYKKGSRTNYFVYGKETLKPVSFGEDSWETIVANVKIGNTSAYNVGDTKEVNLTGFTNTESDSNGLYTIRIVNTSTPEEYNTNGFSQTACGFVIEFEDIITEHNMNSTDTNVGGWEASEMRTYVNLHIYNALPTDLKNNIIDTRVVSGHGNTSTETNFTTTDKLYLLSTKEVWGKEGTTSVISGDTAEAETRQLDYYKTIGVTTSDYSGTIKKYNGSVYYWWLRSARSVDSNYFYGVGNTGIVVGAYNSATYNHGVAVAFRIG